MTRWLDNCGRPVTTYPKALRPSTTLLIARGLHLREYAWRAAGSLSCALSLDFVVHQRADNHHWGFPGGAQEIGESILDCARREAFEETGLDIQVVGLVCVDSDPTTGAICTYTDGCVQYMNMTFLCVPLGDESLRCSDESLRLMWCAAPAFPGPFLKTHRWRFDQLGGDVVVR